MRAPTIRIRPPRRKTLAALTVVACLLATARLPAAPAPPVDAPEKPAVFPGPVRLLLPPVVYAVPGIEVNVYFDNVVLVVSPSSYVFDVTCAKGVQQHERWTFTPNPKDVGTHAFALEVRDAANAVIARAESTLRVVPAEAGAGRELSMLIIGDSLTHASVYSGHVVDLCRPEGNPRIRLIGSHGPGGQPGEENRHEGYGGWTAQRFATHYTGVARTGDYKKRGSPFLYKDGDAAPVLDLPRYCAELNGGKLPDVVTMLLGCNDTFSSDDGTIEGRIDTMFQHYETLVSMIHGARPDTKIGALLLVPPAATQDAFGTNYRCGQTRWQYKRNQQRVVERMLERFGGRESENLYLVPANVNLDCVNNYPQRTAPLNARTDVKGPRLANGVHPGSSGYRQIGDSVYCWLKAVLADQAQ